MIVNIQGGLGNQLFQYAFGRSVSLARNEELFFDVSRCRNQDEYAYSLDAFNVKVQTADGRTGPERGEPVFRYDPTVYTEPTGLFWNGYWQTEKYFNIPVIREELKFKEPTSYFYFSWKAITIPGNSAFIHVRGGDYLKEPHKSFHGNMTLEYYQKAIAHIRTISPNCIFYVFSDNKEWCRANLSEHVLVEGTDKFQDMLLMSLCKHAIIANSSFSWWGAWLGDEQPNRTVIAPQRWFQSTSMCQDDIIPDRWVRM